MLNLFRWFPIVPLGFSLVSMESVDYKILRKIQQEEKSSPLLTKIDDHLFEDASSYHALLIDRMKKEEKPSRQLIISEQIQNVEKIIRNIYEIREKKIILAAIAKARGASPNEKHFLTIEKNMFSTVYSLLLKNRDQLLDTKDVENKKEQEHKVNEKQDMGKKPNLIDEKEHTTKEVKIVRILETIPTFVGTDTKEYNLQKHDIVSLPPPLASMLISKKVAEPVLMKN
jgi:DNA replication initiation complex subunit (GINS family)